MDELELAQAEAEFVHAGLAQHRADRKRGSSLLVPRLQFKRRHRATRLLGFKPKAFQAQGPKAKTAKTTATKKGVRRAVAKYKAGQKATGRPTRPGKGELKARQFDPRGNAPMIVTGSDCSGLDTATAALKMAGLEPCTVFLSEKDAHARKVLESNYATGGAYAVDGIGGLPHAGSKPRIFNNIMARDDSEISAEIDLYTAGPPCQPFSMAGLQNGLQDKRAHVLLRVLQTIKTIQPLTFALENVKPLARHKKFKLLFDFILAFLRSIEDANGEKVYQVECKVPVHCKLFG